MYSSCAPFETADKVIPSMPTCIHGMGTHTLRLSVCVYKWYIFDTICVFNVAVYAYIIYVRM